MISDIILNSIFVIGSIIFYIVYGFFLGQLDTGNLGIAYQIGFGLGNFLSALAGAIIATYFVTNYKFSFKKKF